MQQYKGSGGKKRGNGKGWGGKRLMMTKEEERGEARNGYTEAWFAKQYFIQSATSVRSKMDLKKDQTTDRIISFDLWKTHNEGHRLPHQRS